jgi:hypothetical protein
MLEEKAATLEVSYIVRFLRSIRFYRTLPATDSSISDKKLLIYAARGVKIEKTRKNNPLVYR